MADAIVTSVVVWLTRNSDGDLQQKSDNRKLCDLIATSSIVYNSAVLSNSTRQKCLGVGELQEFLLESQEQDTGTTDYDVMMLLQVRAAYTGQLLLKIVCANI